MRTKSQRATSTPHSEMRTIGQELADLPSDEEANARDTGRTQAMIWIMLVFICLLAFIGWLLVGLPHHVTGHI
jgi:hypothetical protein